MPKLIFQTQHAVKGAYTTHSGNNQCKHCKLLLLIVVVIPSPDETSVSQVHTYYKSFSQPKRKSKIELNVHFETFRRNTFSELRAERCNCDKTEEKKWRRSARKGNRRRAASSSGFSACSPTPSRPVCPRSIRKVQQRVQRQNGWRWTGTPLWVPGDGRGSLSSNGRGGLAGVMEAGVDIVWHYRANFLRRTLRYWFRRAERPARPEFLSLPPFHCSLCSFSLASCFPCCPPAPVFPASLSCFVRGKKGNDWNEPGRGLRVGSAGVDSLAASSLPRACEFQDEFGVLECALF